MSFGERIGDRRHADPGGNHDERDDGRDPVERVPQRGGSCAVIA
jgi:hypothetical protein